MSLWTRFTELLNSAPGGPLAALGASLDPLDKIEAGLADRARRYVLDGSEPQLLLELPRHATAADWLGSPGCAWIMVTGPAMAKVARRSAMDRRRYYRHALGGEFPPEVLERLGRLLLACPGQATRQRPESSLPDWVYLLLMDGLLREDRGVPLPGLDEQQADGHLPKTVATLSALAELAGGGVTETLLLIFERKGVSEYSRDVYAPLLKVDGLDAFLKAEAVALAALPPRLSAAGRQTVAEALATPTRAVVHAELLARLAVDSSKATREAAAKGLQLLEPAARLAVLRDIFESPRPPAERALAAELLARQPDDGTQAWLTEARGKETQKAVIEALDRALSRGAAAEAAAGQELPEPPTCTPLVDGELGVDVVDVLAQNLAELLASTEIEAAREEADKAAGKPTWGQAARTLKEYRKLERADLEALYAKLNGQRPLRGKAKSAVGKVVEAVRGGELKEGLIAVLQHKNRICARPDFGPLQAFRHTALWSRHGEGVFWLQHPFQLWLGKRDPATLDLRQFAEALDLVGWPQRQIAEACLSRNYLDRGPCELLPPEGIWPYFAAHPEVIEEGLGLKPSQARLYMELELGLTLKVLGTFPVIPAAWIPRLLEIAMGEARSHRAAAQALLSGLPDIGARVLEAAGSGKQELKQSALRWLAELGYREAVPALRKMLAKESKELIRAELLATLEALGDDISAELAPARLTAEAEAGAKAKLPADIAWIDFERLPAARWQDGSAVAPVVLRAWVLLAGKLKAPGGNPLISRYLGLLEGASAANLGRSVLAQFIARDTLSPTLAEAEAYADAEVDQRYQNYQKWAQMYPGNGYEDQTRDKVHAALKQEKLGIYLGSAIGAKGLLALIARVPGHELVSTINAYMRDHHTRRAQIEALLEGLSQSSDPAAIQLLLAVSRRHRTASVQEKAKLLVADVAERLGWGPDQLADRTVPTAGLDERGEAELDYGPRQFKLKLDAELKLALFAADGKPLKALPDPRKDEDAAQVKDAKTRYTASKKELSQVLSLQQGRLYEAMCAGRRWPLADWRQYLAGHPIVGRLLQRLVWTAEADGQTWQFRPSEDGAFLDADDEELNLPEHAQISLAHAAVLSADTVKRWLKHLKDYKIKPLFAQLDRPLPPTAADDAELIDDRVGYCADTFGFRGAFTKLGYQRAQAEDGGCFYAYYKPYTSLDLRAVVEFTGSALPETNVAAALRELSFERLGRSGRRVKLSEVPPVLLAEAVADYHKVASIGAFDPQWEQRSPW